MPRKIISEGKTTAEAIEKGLKTLKLSKENVEIKILENEEKRSFFSILTPRTVKVEITEKENEIKKEKNENKINKLTQNDIDIINNNISNFLSEFANKVGNINFTINIEENFDMTIITIVCESISIYLSGKLDDLEKEQNKNE